MEPLVETDLDRRTHILALADRVGRGMGHDRKVDILAMSERERRESGKLRAVQRLLGRTPEFALDGPELPRARLGYDVDPFILAGEVEMDRHALRHFAKQPNV